MSTIALKWVDVVGLAERMSAIALKWVDEVIVCGTTGFKRAMSTVSLGRSRADVVAIIAIIRFGFTARITTGWIHLLLWKTLILFDQVIMYRVFHFRPTSPAFVGCGTIHEVEEDSRWWRIPFPGLRCACEDSIKRLDQSSCRRLQVLQCYTAGWHWTNFDPWNVLRVQCKIWCLDIALRI
jgi:hypothetical protein